MAKKHKDSVSAKKSSSSQKAMIVISIVLCLIAIFFFYLLKKQTAAETAEQIPPIIAGNSPRSRQSDNDAAQAANKKRSADHHIGQNQVKGLEARVMFKRLWKEFSDVDKRNIGPSIERIKSYTCKLKVAETYMINNRALYHDEEDLFSFPSFCPRPVAVVGDENDEHDADDKDDGSANVVENAANVTQLASKQNRTATEKPLIQSKSGISLNQKVKRRMNIANEHHEAENQQNTPLHEQLVKHREQYELDPNPIVSQVPKEYFNIKLAYILLLHNNIDHVRRLLARIYDPNFYYVVHIDSKSTDEYKNQVNQKIGELYKRYAVKRPNVIVFNQYSITWGGPSMIYATMESMKVLHRDFPDDWEYCINLSGADYPLRSNKEIVQELAVNAYLLGKKDISYVDMHLNDLRDNKPIKLGFAECDNYLYLAGWRPLPRGIDIWSGSQWFIMHNSLCKFFMHDELLVPKFLRYIDNMLVSDELFFQTIIKASPFCHEIVHNNLRSIKWRDTAECFFDRIADSCGRHPDNFDSEDLPYLKNERTALFARKFANDTFLLDELDAWMDDSSNQVRDKTSYHIFSDEATCLTAFDDNSVHALPCNHLIDEGDVATAVRESLEEQEWMIAACTDPHDIKYDENEKCFVQAKNSTMCALINKKYQMCLDYSGPDEPTSPLILWPCHFRTKQLWQFPLTHNKKKSCSLITNLSSKIMNPDLCANLNTDSTDANLWVCNDSPDQRLNIVRV